MRILVAGIGNIFLGDDGFGPAVAREVAKASLPPGVRVEDFGIRGVHLAYELMEGYDLLVLLDAAPHGQPPGTVSQIEPDPEYDESDRRVESGGGPLVDAHGMEPMSVLAALRSLGTSVGRVVVVACEPADVAERMGLSEPVAAAVSPAAARVIEMVREEATSPAPTARASHSTKEE